MIQKLSKKELEKKATEIRKHIIKMTGAAGSGHPGGSLSIADIISVLYFHHMNYKPEQPDWPDRDRFVLSKGHGCPALYAALAEAGVFPLKKLLSLRKLGSILQGHPDMRRTPGVEMSSGSLGLGFSTAAGMVLAGKVDKKSYRVFTIIGDGESQEGVIWESAMFAGHHKLSNLVAFLDNNGMQIDGPCSEIVCIEPIDKKWQAFGWQTISIDGHDIDQIIQALEEADKVNDKPIMIIAKTVKGKGVSFMENKVDWHGIAPDQEQVKQALEELENK